MAVHAHPDDESSSTGGVLARYGDEGAQTIVVTCTNGEMGDGPGHVKPGEPGHDPDAVAATRLAELDVACRELGVTDSVRLGYRDSGMEEWEFKHHPDAFCNVPVDVGAARLLELFETYRPDVVITYSDAGGYNHPDHLQAHRITVAAVGRSDIPSKLYLIARRRRDWQAMRARLEALGLEFPQLPEPSPERLAQMAKLEDADHDQRRRAFGRRPQAGRAHRAREPARRVVVEPHPARRVERSVRRGVVHPRPRHDARARSRGRPLRRLALTSHRSG